MNIAGFRSIGSAVLLVLLAGAGCNRPKRASSESSAAPTPQGVRASITAHAPDAFYDPPSDMSRQPGALLRSEPLKEVILPAGVRGWRILYATTVNDSTPATAVATVFAPTAPPAGPRPVIAWEHGTTGLLQKCDAASFTGGFDPDGSGIFQGFVSVGGTLTSFSVPAAISTFAYEINNSNQLVVGYYIDSSAILHGYFRDTNGTLHFPIDPSGSTSTVLFGLNDKNWAVGRYADSSGATHGLFFVPPNQFFTFDYPGSTFTSLNGINDQGFICGRYADASGIAHGFLARVRGKPPTNAAGPEMKAFASPSRVTPLNPSPSAWGDAMPAR